jgi:hypothetical protein
MYKQWVLFSFLSLGNAWMGWDNQSTPIKIGFQFDQLRKFQLVSIHVNNFLSQGAQVIYRDQGLSFYEFYKIWLTEKLANRNVT